MPPRSALPVGLLLMQGSHHLDERFSALEGVQNRCEVCLEDGGAGLLGACSRSAPSPDDAGPLSSTLRTTKSSPWRPR